MSDRSTMSEGWHDLPGGGALEIRGGIPVQVSDNGRWPLDENALLAEAAEASGKKLTWRTYDRSRRWNRGALRRWRRQRSLKGFLGLDVYSAKWSFADVLVAGCDRCACDVGTGWQPSQDDEAPEWCCERCASEGARR